MKMPLITLMAGFSLNTKNHLFYNLTAGAGPPAAVYVCSFIVSAQGSCD